MTDVALAEPDAKPTVADRPLVFISHATPDDNEFVLWLGTRLTALGYDVWADILKLRGGQDWTEALEQALSEKASKVLLVCTPLGLSKSGVKREIKLAQQVAKKIRDDAFIVPLRKEPYELTFDTALSQYIDFTTNWGKGLVELVKALHEYEVPRRPDGRNEVAGHWRALVDGERAVVEPAEDRLVSNAVRITQLPTNIGVYQIAFAGREVVEHALKALTLPHVRVGDDLIIGFCAPVDYLTHVNRAFSFNLQYEPSLADFGQNGFEPIGLKPEDARRHLASLMRQHWGAECSARGLRQFEFAGRSIAWWPTLDRVGDDFIMFPPPFGGMGRRQLVGKSLDLHWHYGVTAIPRMGTQPSFTLVNRVIFTSDGTKVIADATKMHRLRRSRCKMWHNDRWRDLVQAFAHWLAEGNDTITLPCGSNDPIEVSAQPTIYVSNVRLVTPDVGASEPPDEGEEFDDDDE
jgi:TIR domain-containing protein